MSQDAARHLAPQIVRSRDLPFEKGRTPGVEWKRFESSAVPESRGGSSLVRYQPGAVLPLHDHAGGEEILVLAGSFSDQRGEFPKRSHQLNPEGFRHAPFSREGCLMFVRLGRYSGAGRSPLSQRVTEQGWVSRGFAGASRLFLYQNTDYSAEIWLTRLAPGTTAPRVEMPHGEEIFVLEGSFSDEFGSFEAHDWLEFPPGSVHTPRTQTGCLLYVARDTAQR